MATALKDISFNSPVLQGCARSGLAVDWRFGDNDTVYFGSCGYEQHSGCEQHYGYEYHSGYEQHYGCEQHCGYEQHSGCEQHYGYEYHYGYEHHSGYEDHGCSEHHYGCEDHCGYEHHSGWVQFSGSCDCATDGFTGTSIRVSGIAVVDPTNPSNKVLLTYSELKSHGF